MRNTPEGQLLQLCLDWLAAKGIFAVRVNSGLARMGNRRFQMSTPGMSDLIVLPEGKPAVFAELKAGTKLTETQRSFGEKVEVAGHRYRVVRSLEDLMEAIR